VWVSRRPRRLLQKKKKPLERGGVSISHRLVLAIARKNPPQMIGGDKKARTERCVGCTLLVCIWKAKRDGVWVAHHLVRVWKVERGGMWVAHRLAGLWNDAAGGRGHKRPPPHLRFPLSFSFPLFLPPCTPFAILLAPSVFVMWRGVRWRAFLSGDVAQAVVVVDAVAFDGG